MSHPFGADRATSTRPTPGRRGRRAVGKRGRGGRDAAAVAGEVATVDEVRPHRPAGRGWGGRGGGASQYLQLPDMWRGTTVQVCGLWPFAIGSGSPVVGVPLGRHLHSGATVCCDPISWFQRAKLISNPSMFVLGLPGRGKSTLVRRMVGGLAGFGTLPLVLGDLRPDYVDLVEAMGGQVIRLGRGRGHINVLDPGESVEAARRLRASGHDTLADGIEADAHGRRITMVSALLTIMRKQPPTDVEESIVDQALRLLDREGDRVPVLADLLRVIQAAPAELREVAVDRGSMKTYHNITGGLERSLTSLIRGGRLGEVFSQPTTTSMRRDRPVVYDISGLIEADADLRAAMLLACWSSGFATVNVAQAMADAGLEPQRHYFIVLDELWQALRSGSGMVERVDFLTRLNRKVAVGQAMITHTMSDLTSLPTEEDRTKAAGLVERAGMVICGGLPQSEMAKLTGVLELSQIEQTMLQSWSSPPTFDSKTGRETEPPGLGKFLIKVGGRPGIPLRVLLTDVEKASSDTNRLWHAISRVGQGQIDPEPAAEILEAATGLDLHADDPAPEPGAGGQAHGPRA